MSSYRRLPGYTTIRRAVVTGEPGRHTIYVDYKPDGDSNDLIMAEAFYLDTHGRKHKVIRVGNEWVKSKGTCKRPLEFLVPNYDPFDGLAIYPGVTRAAAREYGRQYVRVFKLGAVEFWRWYVANKNNLNGNYIEAPYPHEVYAPLLDNPTGYGFYDPVKATGK